MKLARTTFHFIALTAILLSTLPVTAMDEGMYTPDQIARLDLKKRGLKIKPEAIYDPAGGGLSEAVVRLSIGCTASFVSPEGLILTNHHCGFDGLVQASSPENDLVETGFKADNRAGEIPAKGYGVFVTQRVEDVSAKVRAGTESLTGEALAAALKKNTDDLQAAEQARAPAASTIRIQSLNSGYFYYLYQTMQIKDVRLVYAPPRSIGVFGGDPDNFEWTRHTGDFAFLRAYTAPDGTSAEYSPNNVPYKSKIFLAMNIAGIDENDFVFVLGYPGNTTRYRESQSIAYARDANFPFLSAYLDARSAALRLIGETNPEKRIQFQSEIANFDNYRKVYKGSAEKFVQADVVAKRQAEETRFAAWINEKPERKGKYGNVLTELDAVSKESNAFAKRDVILGRFPSASLTPVFKQVYDAVKLTAIEGKILNDADRAAKLKEIEEAYKDREPVYEREMIKFMLSQLAALPAGQKFEPAEKLFGTLQGSARRDAEAEFAESIATGEYASATATAGLYGPRTMDFKPERERILGFMADLAREKTAMGSRNAKFASNIDRLRLLYQQGMSEMKGVTPYPDANSTLRFTYGNVKGYSPREAVYYTPFTTMKGMWEKDTGVNPFDMPEKLKTLQRSRDFGRFGEGDSVVVNFLSTNDIIGGNSGSPVMNGSGQLVGLCFDGNYEGLGNDMYYDPAKGRTISVDIRYVLFVTEKFGGAGWLLDEMKLVGGPKARSAAIGR
ncbi:MAG: S46 family peptidase [Pyrinomonadaceae bacterium]